MFYEYVFTICAIWNMFCSCKIIGKPEGLSGVLNDDYCVLGAPCTWGQYNGTCLDVRKCYTFILDKRDENLPPICSFHDNVPVVCCTECPDLHVEDISNAIWSYDLGIQWKRGPRAQHVCLQYRIQLPYLDRLHSQLVNLDKAWDHSKQCHFESLTLYKPTGGEDTRRAEYPYMFTYGTVPACLHAGDRHDIREAIALGWGSLGPGKHLADILQKVKLQYFTDEQCAKIYTPHRLLRQGYNSTTQMCYGDRNTPRDTCEGDSGGPLVLHRNASYAQDLIIGVTSYGIECGHATAGIYTRVDHYLPWITSIVWP